MRRPQLRTVVLAGLLVAVAFGALASPFASSAPDGLERVGRDSGFAAEARLHPVQEEAPVPDYALPGVRGARLATSLAGLAGTLVVFVVAVGLAWVVRRRGGDPDACSEPRRTAAP